MNEITQLPLARLEITTFQIPETGKCIAYKFKWLSDESLFAVSNELLMNVVLNQDIFHYDPPRRMDAGTIMIGGKEFFAEVGDYPDFKVFRRHGLAPKEWSVVVMDNGYSVSVYFSDGKEGRIVAEDESGKVVTHGQSQYEAIVRFKELMEEKLKEVNAD